MIVVDDGSTDRSPQVLKNLAKEYKKLKFVISLLMVSKAAVMIQLIVFFWATYTVFWHAGFFGYPFTM